MTVIVAGVEVSANTADWTALATIEIAARIMLAALFLTAGVNKLRRPLGAATAALQFRVVGQATPGVGYTLGTAEVVIGLLLVGPTPVAAIGCLAAAALSLGFVVVSVLALRRGERFPCGCLSISVREHVSWLTVVRAGAMTVSAVFAGSVAVSAGGAAGDASLDAAAGLAIIALGLPVAVVMTWRIHRHNVRHGGA
ncbi:MauE/DoxX family redox-associated membrane protein [Actinophytocola sp.]|uniref:MauE/DoxX family redox-associated membrane protein n=1 Tax=Actinophytocola sp. TaxID=1872138 RepID=UPI003899F4B2